MVEIIDKVKPLRDESANSYLRRLKRYTKWQVKQRSEEAVRKREIAEGKDKYSPPTHVWNARAACNNPKLKEPALKRVKKEEEEQHRLASDVIKSGNFFLLPSNAIAVYEQEVKRKIAPRREKRKKSKA